MGILILNQLALSMNKETNTFFKILTLVLKKDRKLHLLGLQVVESLQLFNCSKDFIVLTMVKL